MQIEFYPTSIEANIAGIDMVCYTIASMEPHYLWYKGSDFDIHIGDTYRERNFRQATQMPLSSGFVLYPNILDAAQKAYELNSMKGDPFPYVMVKCVIPCRSRYYNDTEQGGKLFSTVCAERIKVEGWKKVGEREWHTVLEGDDGERYNTYFNIITE